MIALVWAFIRGINPRVYLGIALCIATLYGWHRLTGHYIEIGRQEVRTEWAIEKAEREEKENDALIARQKENAEIEKKQAETNALIKKGHANEIAKIHTSYATTNRLRLPSTVCDQFAASGKAIGTSGSDAATAATIALPEPIERDLRGLAMEADTMLAGCRSAQKFIIDNGFAP